MKRLARAFLRFARVLFLLACLLIAAGAYLLSTENGLRLILRMADTLVPGLSTGTSTGSLWDGFQLNDLAYRDAALELDIRQLEFRWQPRALRDGLLHVNLLRTEGTRITTRDTEESKQPPQWPNVSLPLAVQLDELRLRDLAIVTAPEQKPVEIQRIDGILALDETGLHVESLEGVSDLGDLAVSGTAGFGAAAALDLHTRWRVTLEHQPELKGAGTLTGGPAKLIVQQHLEAPITAAARVEIADPLGAPQWQAKVTLPRFDPRQLAAQAPPWPLSADLVLRGAPDGVQVEGQVDAQLPEVGDAAARLAGNYRWNGAAAIDSLTLTLPATGTQFDLRGSLQRIPDALKLDVDAKWQNLAWPPGPKPQWRSPEGTLRVSGEQRDIRFDLRGKLRDYPVSAVGNLGVDGDTLAFRNLRIDGAGVQAKMDGTLGPELNFQWQIDAADLGLWLPGAHGELHSRGTLAGSRASPAVNGEIAGRGLAFGEYAAGAVNLTATAGIQPDSPFRFRLAASDLRAAGRRIDAELDGQGTRAKHHLQGQIRSDPYRLSLAAEGGLENDRWTGNLQHFDLDEPALGGLVLQRPALLSVGATGSELKPACWTVTDASLCLNGQVNGQQHWRIAADLDAFALAALRKELPESTTLSGSVDACIRLEGDTERLGSGEIDVDFRETKIQVRAGDQTFQFAPESPQIRAWAANRHGQLSFSADQPGVASLSGRVDLSGNLDFARLSQIGLDGGMRLDVANLALIQPWVPEAKNLAGRVEANLDLSGSPARPALDLAASVRDAAFSVPRLGIDIKGVQLSARSQAPNLVGIEGRALSGGGDLRLTGTAALGGNEGLKVDAKLLGQRFLAVEIPEAKARISPDLSLNLQGNKLTASGSVRIPEANIAMPEQNQAVKPSGDVVMVGESPKDQANGMKIAAKVDVILGSKVQVAAAGFKGRLDGHVLIDQAPGAEPLGTGQINVREGTYAYFGVALAIKEGRAMFAHSEVDNPALYVNVTREESNVSAGLKVLGTARKPEIVLYSDPPMAQADILSYVLTGKSFNFASDQQGSVLRQAASSLSGPAANLVAKEISNRLGLGNWIDDIGVQTRPGSQSPALYLGKYLTPRLYVQYGLSFFQNTNVFRMRYDLSKHWKLQTETGEQSGGDILFEWEQ